ncbi:extracellular solute-binding protein [Streptomyces sp. A7024]|uniref:Extracellular solute-binding protein n=1 Tax=Streptomyces coryli TaxID=1128680 RepID=A0A6G4U1B1_9ACTN|nr:extracellular solute-binding protein [Streptomyces coryli]NGN65067.1 extracellular solute-binding protein [Streptomyces coryli]
MRSTGNARKRVRTAAAAAAVLSLALGAAGCGDDDSGGGGNGKGGGQEETVKLPKLDGQSIQVAGTWTGPEQKSFKVVLDEFSKRTGAEVKFVPTGDNVAGFVGTKQAGGAPPDVVFAPQVGVLQEFVEKGWAKPVNSAVQKELKQNFVQGWQDLGAVDGKQYGVYYKAANKSLVWYNTNAFEQAGVQEPKTWDDFIKTAQTISDSGVAPVSVGGADGWTLTDWFENIYLSQAGPEKYDQLAKHEIKWTDPSVKDALTTLGELFGEDSLMLGGKNTALKTPFPDSITKAFTPPDAPKAAMVFEGDFVASFIGDTKAEVGKDAKLFPFPAVGNESPVVSGGDAAVILKDNKASQAFLTFLASPDAAKIWAERGGFASPNKNLKISTYPNDVQKTIAEALIQAGNDFRFDMSDQAPAAFGGTKGAGEWKALQDFLKDPKDVAGAQKQLETDAAKAYK